MSRHTHIRLAHSTARARSRSTFREQVGNLDDLDRQIVKAEARYPVASRAWFGSVVFCACAQDISGAVNHRNDVDLVGFDVVNDAVRPLDQFSNLLQIIFWHATTRERSIGNLLGPASQAVNHAQCVLR